MPLDLKDFKHHSISRATFAPKPKKKPKQKAVEAEPSNSEPVKQFTTISPVRVKPEAPPQVVSKLPPSYTRIDCFVGLYNYLDVDFQSEIHYDGLFYPTLSFAMLAVQYPKLAPKLCTDAKETLGPKDAWFLAAGQDENPLWVSKKTVFVEQMVRDKFRRNGEIRKKLQETGLRELVFTPPKHLQWSEATCMFWGSVAGRGQNYMGRILSDLRADIGNEMELDAWLCLCHPLEREDAHRPPITLIEQKHADRGVDLNPKRYDLQGKAYYFIGKLPTNDVVANHPSISRVHALIAHTTKGVQLFDLASKAGTFLNNRLVTVSHLGIPVKSGNDIRLGGSSRKYITTIDLNSVIAKLEKKRKHVKHELVNMTLPATAPGVEGQPTTCWMGNLPFKCTKLDIENLLEENSVGTDNISISLPQDRSIETEDPEVASRGIAFVTFENTMQARRALNLSGHSFQGRKIKIELSQSTRREEDRRDERIVREERSVSRDSRDAIPRDRDKRHRDRDRDWDSKRPWSTERDKEDFRDRDRDRGDRGDKGDRGDRGDREQEDH
eukprot:Platyproteum_vivax@DN4333_c0_g1_i1.p1